MVRRWPDADAEGACQGRNRQIGFIFPELQPAGRHDGGGTSLPLTYRGLSAARRHELVERALDRVGRPCSGAPATYRPISRGVRRRRSGAGARRGRAGHPARQASPPGGLGSRSGEGGDASCSRELHRGSAAIMHTSLARFTRAMPAASSTSSIGRIIGGAAALSAHAALAGTSATMTCGSARRLVGVAACTGNRSCVAAHGGGPAQEAMPGLAPHAGVAPSSYGEHDLKPGSGGVAKIAEFDVQAWRRYGMQAAAATRWARSTAPPTAPPAARSAARSAF